MSQPREAVFPIERPSPDHPVRIEGVDLLHLSAGDAGVVWQLAADAPETAGLYGELAPGDGVLLACADTALQLHGDGVLRRPGVNAFCKLLAFLDAGDGGTDRPAGPMESLALPLAPHVAADPRVFEYWFIHQHLAGCRAFASLQLFLRRLENYWLVKFLLAESSQLKSIGDLGSEYGLSYSHFRRICKSVLGNSVKAEMKVWRAARSLLDAVDRKGNMTEVAIRNGYASSSHFSTEIKNLFGLSPRAILELKP